MPQTERKDDGAPAWVKEARAKLERIAGRPSPVPPAEAAAQIAEILLRAFAREE